MHKLNIFPLGNADSCRIDLECGQKEIAKLATVQAELEGYLKELRL